jgi:hypothetical protein
MKIRLLSLILLLFFLGACQPKQTPSQPQDDPSTIYDESIAPDPGQPPFPKLGQYWVVDNGCGFDTETVKWADQIFEQLRLDRIAEVALVCQTGIQSRGPLNDEKIWAMEWGRWARLGDKQDRRAIVWLIRPDVKPEENRVTIEVSTWLTWYTAIDYGDTLESAANYANWNNFSGALEEIARGTDASLRELWSHRNGQP